MGGIPPEANQGHASGRFGTKGAEGRAPRFALVLSGGGARGAYEAGVMHYIRTKLPREIAEKPLFQIYSGTSVGAINCASLAANAEDPLFQAAYLRKLWTELRPEDVYFADKRALAGFLMKSGFFMATNFMGFRQMLGNVNPDTVFPFRAVLDTTPFVNYLRRNVSWGKIHRNIERGIIDAVSVSASHLRTGKLALFVEKGEGVQYSSGGVAPLFCQLSPKHILASAAIPLIFPVIRVNREYYGDGSMRQNTPMSPAMHLGADRLLVIALRTTKPHIPPPPTGGKVEGEPRVSNILGHMLNTVFLDKIDYDLEQMRRINFLLQDLGEVYGENVMERVNRYREKLDIPGKKIHPIREVRPFVISPSEDIGHIAADLFNKAIRNKETLNPLHRFFANVLEAEGDNDFMSYLLFEREYLDTLIDLGFSDAAREHDRLVNFFTNQPLDGPPPIATGEDAGNGVE